jgi:hypothetical protein
MCGLYKYPETLAPSARSSFRVYMLHGAQQCWSNMFLPSISIVLSNTSVIFYTLPPSVPFFHRGGQLPHPLPAPGSSSPATRPGISLLDFNPAD